MDARKASDELAVIRQLMERPVRYSTASGLSGILAGLAALSGALADKFLLPRAAICLSERYPETSPYDWEFLLDAAVWAVVFVSAFLGAVILTRIRERRQGMPFWSNVKRRILRTILMPFAAAVGLTLAIQYQWIRGFNPTQAYLIPAAWMLFYGVALWQLGEFSVPEISLLGAVFVVAGIVAAVVQPLPYLSMGVTFGGFHLVYGTVVLVRHGG